VNPMSRFTIVDTRLTPFLYHWQRFNSAHLETLLRDNVIWFSRPDTFNDPWDCKPCFSSNFVDDPVEVEKHLADYAEITRKHRPEIPESFIAQRQQEFRTNPQMLAEKIVEIYKGLWPQIADRYRVYCMGPDPGNVLMWSHYADSHKGICLEFSTRNVVMCSATQLEYCNEFPMVRLYSKDEDDNLVPLLTKADVWSYEREYRLVAQDRGNSTPHDTLLTEANYLRLPPNALTSIIVGCQAPFDEVEQIVRCFAPGLPIRKALREPDRYALTIE
jgi:hypothetical protein